MTDHFDTKSTPEAASVVSDDSPKFGRLLIVLVIAVGLIVGLTFAAEAWYS